MGRDRQEDRTRWVPPADIGSDPQDEG
jgi:hypothetical protein